MSRHWSIDWRRIARATLRLSLHTAGWLLTHGGRLLQDAGGLVSDLCRAPNPAPPDPRRE